MTLFENCFTPDSESLKMGLKLRKLVYKGLENIEESIMGGVKVKLALYSRGGSSNVLCGIQEGKENSCMFYVHHLDSIDHERLKFTGKGKHAKRIGFNHESEILVEDILWLLDLVNEKAPF